MIESSVAAKAPTPAPGNFGATLRWERERRGITLDAIAERTKVSARLFASLEQNDLSSWPGGIFRRAFIRGYAEAVGLDPDKILREFFKLFPSDEPAAPKTIEADRKAGAPSVPATTLRLTLADEGVSSWRHALSRVSSRLIAVAIDMAAVLTPALAAAVVRDGYTFWIALACTSLLYYTAGALAFGSTPGAWAASYIPSGSGRVRRGANVIPMNRKRPDLPLALIPGARRFRRRPPRLPV